MTTQRIFRKNQIHEVTGLSFERIDVMVREGKFPRPIRLCEGGRAVGWMEEDIAQWQQERIAASLAEQGVAAE